MKKTEYIAVAIFLGCALGMGWAQDTGTQQPADQVPQSAPAPAFGRDTTTQNPVDNPPISGLDQPSLEPRIAANSFLQPSAHLSESVDSNLAGSTGGSSGLASVTRATVGLLMQKFWTHYETDLNYDGGGAIYSNFGRRFSQYQRLDAVQRVLWRTGQLAVRDSFSYLPEGTFGFGSAGAVTGTISGVGSGISGTNLGGSFGAGQFGSLGQVPRVTNSAVVDVANSLSPRSSVTMAAGYGIIHFTGSTPGLVNSQQLTFQGGYDHEISRKDQLALVYGFQRFDFPQVGGSSFDSHTVYLLYGHRLSGRLDLLLGGGPQITFFNSSVLGSTRRVTGSAKAMVRYRFPRTSLSANYDRHTTNGSGFFLGAQTDTGRLALSRPLNRQWNGVLDFGVSRNQSIQSSATTQSGNTYTYFFAGATAHRTLGRYLRMYVRYQYNDLRFGNSGCGAGSFSCNSSSQRHVGTIGLDWYPRPIRLD